MTLKELIMKVDFDSLRPYLEKFEQRNLDNIYAFREAYDILRRMKPEKGGLHEIRVIKSGRKTEGEKEWICVYPMDTACWKENLAANIIVDSDVHLTDEELAMNCLREITLWGFFPKSQQ